MAKGTDCKEMKVTTVKGERVSRGSKRLNSGRG